MCTNFQFKRTTLIFLAQICPKRKLGFEIQETNVGIRISILEIPCVPIFRQNGQLWIFGPKFAQKWILGSKFQKPKSGFGISILEILCAPIFRQNGQLLIFGPKFAQISIFDTEFQKSKSGFEISIFEILYALIFQQNGQLWIFEPKFTQIWILGTKFQNSKSGFGIRYGIYSFRYNTLFYLDSSTSLFSARWITEAFCICVINLIKTSNNVCTFRRHLPYTNTKHIKFDFRLYSFYG